jgi:hypothetical protein
VDIDTAWALGYFIDETFLVAGSIIDNDVMNRDTDEMLPIVKLYQKEVE